MRAEANFRLWTETADLRTRIAMVQFAVGCAIAAVALLHRMFA